MTSRLLGCWQGDIEASDDMQATRVLAGGIEASDSKLAARVLAGGYRGK
jgi:hypothetical protein